MDTLLLLLALLGPFFSISRLIGVERTRRIELKIINHFKDSKDIAVPLLKLALVVFGLFLFFIALVALNNTTHLLPIYWIIIIDSVIVTLWIWGVRKGRGWLWIWGWDLKFIHKTLQALSIDWRQKTNSPSPWPIHWMEGSYKVPETFWIASGLPLLVAYYSFLRPGIFLLTVIALSPFWYTEQVRKKLTPENPNYLDLMGYFVSVISVVFLVYQKVILA